MAEIKNIGKKASFWDKIFREDIVRQANFVEILGWVGLAGFVCLAAFLLPVQMDVTVPAKAVRLQKTASPWPMEADLEQMYFPKVRIGQIAHIAIRLGSGEKVEITGKVAAVELQPGQSIGKIYINPIDQEQKAEKIDNIIEVGLRIVIDRRSMKNIFMGGGKIKNFIL